MSSKVTNNYMVGFEKRGRVETRDVYFSYVKIESGYYEKEHDAVLTDSTTNKKGWRTNLEILNRSIINYDE